MSNAPEAKLDEIGDTYGERTRIEYGHDLKQSKDALGWADFRMTDHKQIERSSPPFLCQSISIYGVSYFAVDSDEIA
jgi:hypothetical protein